MVTTNQKPTIDTQKNQRERNTSIPLKKIIKQGKNLKEEEKYREEVQKQSKTSNKMAISTYLSIMTLNVNGELPSW